MRPTIEGPPHSGAAKTPLAKRLMWFAALWVCGVVATAGVAYALRALIM